VLNEEMTEHLGYEKHEPAGAGTGNIRNGTRAKTVLTDTTGQVEIDVPRDRAATFEPQTVKKRQRRLSSVDEVVLSLYAHRRLRCSAGCSAAACVDRDPSIAVTLAAPHRFVQRSSGLRLGGFGREGFPAVGVVELVLTGQVVDEHAVGVADGPDLLQP
jgi:Transposase, Mutator family